MSQMELTGKSKSQKKTIKAVKKQIEDIEGEIKNISNSRDEESTILGLSMNLERYGASKLPWYLDPKLTEYYEKGELYLNEIYPILPPEAAKVEEKPPDPNDYRIITYWEAHTKSDGDVEKFNEIKEKSETGKFIKDRLDWAEVQFLSMLSPLKDKLEELEQTSEEWGMVE